MQTSQKLPPSGLKSLWVVPEKGFTPAERTLAQTLQGLVGRKKPQIWFRSDSMYAIIEAQLKQEGVALREAGSVWELVKAFQKDIKGAILYRKDTPSVNVATSLCGPMDAVAVEESLAEQATQAGLKTLVDARAMDEKEAWAKYRKLFGSGIAVEQDARKSGHLRDFAVAHNAFTFYTQDVAFRAEVARGVGPKALVFGWGPDELDWVKGLSRGDATGAPSDWSLNLSALERLPAGPLKRPARPALTLEDGVRYLAFVMSDGDNLQWLTNNFVNHRFYWASPLRGTFPMTWEISTLLPRFAPRVMQHIYATAKPTDGFIAGPGVPGYTFPHLQTDRVGIARQAAPMLREADLPVVSVLNTNEGDLRDVAPLLDLAETDGVIYKDYSPYHRRKGELLWHQDKPCLAYRYLIWENLMEPEALVKALESQPANPRKDPASFAVVNVHAWSYGKTGGPMEAIERTIKMLPSNVRVVTADQIISTLRANARTYQGKTG